MKGSKSNGTHANDWFLYRVYSRAVLVHSMSSHFWPLIPCTQTQFCLAASRCISIRSILCLWSEMGWQWMGFLILSHGSIRNEMTHKGRFYRFVEQKWNDTEMRFCKTACTTLWTNHNFYLHVQKVANHTLYTHTFVQQMYLHLFVPAGSPSRGGDVAAYVLNTCQPSLPTPFYSVLVTVSVFMALSTVFHSLNSPDNSPLSHCFSRLISAVLVLSTTYLFTKVSLSPDIILCGWLGLTHQLTNYLLTHQLTNYLHLFHFVCFVSPSFAACPLVLPTTCFFCPLSTYATAVRKWNQCVTAMLSRKCTPVHCCHFLLTAPTPRTSTVRKVAGSDPFDPLFTTHSLMHTNLAYKLTDLLRILKSKSSVH